MFNRYGGCRMITIGIRMWYMVSSPATPTVCPEQKPEYFQKSQRDIIDAVK